MAIPFRREERTDESLVLRYTKEVNHTVRNNFFMPHFTNTRHTPDTFAQVQPSSFKFSLILPNRGHKRRASFELDRKTLARYQRTFMSSPSVFARRAPVWCRTEQGRCPPRTSPQGGPWGQPECVEAGLRHHQTARRRIVLLAGLADGCRAASAYRAHCSVAFGGLLWPDVRVANHGSDGPPAARYSDRDPSTANTLLSKVA